MSRRLRIYRYFVEGECEKVLIGALKRLNYIQSGTVEVFNVVQRRVPQRKLLGIKPNTTIVMVFDTDIPNLDILKENIELFRNCTSRVRKVLLIPQVQNLEDELIRACALTNIKELLNSRSQRDFKHDFLTCSNLEQILNRSLDLHVFWSSSPKGPFSLISNDAHEIKKIPRIAKR